MCDRCLLAAGYVVLKARHTSVMGVINAEPGC